MADNGWTARLATAAGAAAGTGAAQLGLGYGLGVVVWPVTATGDDSVWLGSLGWATWITASATVFGAVIAVRFGRDPIRRPHGPWRFALAVAAAIGALVTVALIALPARSAVRADTFSPQIIAAGYGLIGLVFGLVVAYWAVVSRPVAANLIGTAVWLWALATSAIVAGLVLHRASATYLTSWQFAEATESDRYGVISWPSALLTLGAAFVVGVVAVVPDVRLGNRGVGAATSGAVGPLLVAASFLVLAPRLTGALGPLESAYLIAPYAVLAGLAGSAATVSVAQAALNRSIAAAATARDDGAAIGVATVPASATQPRESTVSEVPPGAAATPPGTGQPATALPEQADPEPAKEPEPAAGPGGGAPRPPKVATPASGVTDREITAAVRPGRPRAAKAAHNSEETATRTTVTPPPASPAVAQINPQPPPR